MLFHKEIQALCLLTLASFFRAEQPIACPLGYEQKDNHCFLLLKESLTFWEATTACDVIDGKLVEIVSPEEQTRVKQYLQGTTGDVWMGATRLQGTWMFLTSKNADALGAYKAWAPTFPKDPVLSDAANCAAISLARGWMWVNAPCSYHQMALCEVRLRADPIIGR